MKYSNHDLNNFSVQFLFIFFCTIQKNKKLKLTSIKIPFSVFFLLDNDLKFVVPYTV